MSDEQKPQDNFSDEFRNLGNNLLGALRSLWDSPERKRLTEELESNLNELSATLRKEVESFNESPTAQRLKEDVGTLHGKVRVEIDESGVKDDILAALRTANNELSKVIERWSGASENRSGEGTAAAQGATAAPASPTGDDEIDPARQEEA